jgi:hypothetical protein
MTRARAYISCVFLAFTLGPLGCDRELVKAATDRTERRRRD